MPGMPRQNKRASKVAFSILGKPANIAYKRSKEEQEINRRLFFEETFRAR